MAGKGSIEECIHLANRAIEDGSAYNKFIEMVEAQGGDSNVIKDVDKFEKSKYVFEVKSEYSGYIYSMDTESLGIASVMLGAGRETKDSIIDFSAGIIINKKYGEYIEAGEVLATMYANDESLFEAAAKKYLEAIEIKNTRPEIKPLIYARVGKDEILRF